MSEEAKLAHIARDDYVEAMLERGEPVYALCGAELQGKRAGDEVLAGERRICPRCKQLYEGVEKVMFPKATLEGEA